MSKALRDLRVVVVGCGSIGSRHARNLRALGVGGLALCDLDAVRAGKLAGELGDALVSADLEALLARQRPHAVLVCTPPTSHLAVAAWALDAGAHVFCEKPLAPSLEGVDELLARAATRQRFLMMAMCYRFHAGLRRLDALLRAGTIGAVRSAQIRGGHWLPDWHPWADYRVEYSARRDLGGGVLLDSIHAFDTVRWLLGEPIAATGMLGKVSDLEIDTEDVASAVLRLESGALVEVHVDYLQRHAQNRIEVIGADGTMTWDFHAQRIAWRRAGIAAWTEETVQSDVNAMYFAELREFVDAIASGRRPAPDGVEGRRTLAVACAVRAAAMDGRMVELGSAPQPARARMRA